MKGAACLVALGLTVPAVGEAQTDVCTQAPDGIECQVVTLADLAGAAPDGPSACAVLKAVADRLDLRSFPNSTVPRIDRDKATMPGDLFVPHVLPLCAALVLEDLDWRMAFVPIGIGDWTGDGLADALVTFEDRSTVAGYAVTEALILTGIGEEGAVTALRACEVIDAAGCPSR